jgi:hypothetical protein
MDRNDDGHIPPSVSEAGSLVVWQRRAIRAWLILLLPLAAFFAYRAADAHFDAQNALASAENWYQEDLRQEREGIPKGTFSIDPKDMHRDSIRWHYNSVERRDSSAMWAALLLTLPLAGWLGVRVARWIWVGGKQNEGPAAAIEGIGFVRSRVAKLGKAALLLVPATVAVATMFLFAPAAAGKVLVSTAVQAVVVVLAVWLYRQFKR